VTQESALPFALLDLVVAVAPSVAIQKIAFVIAAAGVAVAQVYQEVALARVLARHFLTIAIDGEELIILGEHLVADAESITDDVVSNAKTTLVNQVAIAVRQTCTTITLIDDEVAHFVIATMQLLTILADSVQLVWLLRRVGSLANTLLHLVVDHALPVLVDQIPSLVSAAALAHLHHDEELAVFIISAIDCHPVLVRSLELVSLR